VGDCPTVEECGAIPAPLALVATYSGALRTQAAQLAELTPQIEGK